MKLAEALQERADLARQIDRLAGRLNLNVIYQEGEKPAEDPKELFKELDAASDRLRELIGRINSTNCQTVCDGKTLTQMIADKDVLVKKLACYKNVAMSASQTAARARGTEIEMLSAVDVKKLQKQIDDMSKELRQLDNKIQSLNWTTELI